MKSDYTNKFTPIRILAIHGFTGEPFDFAPLYESERMQVDWRFVSLPGHYRELSAPIIETGMCEWELFCRRIDEIVQEAKGDEVMLVGFAYSMGARLLLRAQIEHQWDIERMVLIGATAGLEDCQERLERLETDQQWADLILTSGMEIFVEQWMRQPIIATQRESITEEQVMRKKLLRPRPLADALMHFSNGKLPPVWDQLAQLNLRIDLVSGELDQKFQALHLRMSQQLPQCWLHVIAEAGHAPHVELPGRVIECLNRLFQE